MTRMSIRQQPLTGLLSAITHDDVVDDMMVVQHGTGIDVTAVDDAANTPSKKRRRSGGPARAAREAAFLASKAHDATDDP